MTAVGNFGSCQGENGMKDSPRLSPPLPVTVGNKGLRPPLNSYSVAPRQEGFESPSVLFLLPSADCRHAFFNPLSLTLHPSVGKDEKKYDANEMDHIVAVPVDAAGCHNPC